MLEEGSEDAGVMEAETVDSVVVTGDLEAMEAMGAMEAEAGAATVEAGEEAMAAVVAVVVEVTQAVHSRFHTRGCDLQRRIGRRY